MSNKIILYHGSENIINNPEYGKGKPYNDYGLGFYCTEHIELAKEWACSDLHSGYANKYELDLTGLKILDLNSNEYSILHWITILLANRKFTLDNEIAKASKEYLLKNFSIDTKSYDIIKGYRADDSYFAFARDFLQNTISLNKLSEAMKLGDLGKQIVLISKKAFSQITFLGYEEASLNVYNPLRKRRDLIARLAYASNKINKSFDPNDILMIDILRGGITPNDPRL